MGKQGLDAYRRELWRLVENIDADAFQHMVDILLETYRANRQVFIFGNGGSAATANHFVCDFGKNAVQGDKRRFRILSLSDNVEKITALGNDLAFDEIFRQQLINLMQEGDAVIAVSASGNSPNVVRALEYARQQKGRIIALAGFDGGKIRGMADVCLVAHSNSYERVEDVHLILLHMVVCYMKEHQELLV